jgi:hypothetical protein
MKKFFPMFLSVIILLSIGTAQATEFTLDRVYKANKIWFFDKKNDDGIDSLDTVWSREAIYNRGAKIGGNTDRLAKYLDVDLDLQNGDGDGIIHYAIFKNTQKYGEVLKAWGRLFFEDDGDVVIRNNRNLERGAAIVATWRFGKRQPSQSFTDEAPGSSDSSPVASVPEPASMLLFGAGLIGFGVYRKISSKKS